MLHQPITLVEYLADFAGLAIGFATSPRNIAIGVIALVLGIFRLSAAWALLLAGFAGLSHVYLLSIAGRYGGFSVEYKNYLQSMTLFAAVLVVAIFYVAGRTVRFLKSPMLSENNSGFKRAQSVVPETDDGAESKTTEEQSLRPFPSIDFSRSHRMNQPVVAVLLGGGLLFLLVGFGIQVHRFPPPETPVLFGYVKQPGQGLVWRYATVECVRNGYSLEGYVWKREEMMNPVNVFDLQPDIAIGSLAQARDLARKMRHLRDADPICSQSKGFEGEGQSLIFSLFQ